MSLPRVTLANRPGVVLGLDPGDARIGVAASDPDRILASPVETVTRAAGDVDAIIAIAADRGAVLIVVGLPRALRGGENPATVKVREFAHVLAVRSRPVPVRLVDERFTTVTAERELRAQGRHRQRRRAVVDQVAAVVILQNVLDTERATGVTPGEVLELGNP